jgi:hypothetical protein
MKAKVILNPYAKRWNARLRWPEAEAALKAAGVDFELVVSEHQHHTVQLAEEAVRQGFSPVIAAGGVFYMAPHADPFDGKLTFVYGYRKTRRRSSSCSR